VPVELLGNLGQEDLRDALSQAHLLVLPSIQDGFGMVAPQAMACGTACLISDAAGACEIIEDGRTGWVFPSGDVEALTRRLAAASENLPMLVKMGESARQSVLEMGGWQDYGQKAVQILNSIEPAQAA
jgi:glycosyltransferase involved in cell wall biosynthesis